jgi:signal transduction histidine kinase
LKYSPAEGVVTVHASRIPPLVDGSEDEGVKWVELSVEDRGSGIPREDLPHIFQRFYRADKARSRELGGTGLGLAIVKHIAQAHGGSVRAESEVGRGTKVTVRLPA